MPKKKNKKKVKVKDKAEKGQLGKKKETAREKMMAKQLDTDMMLIYYQIIINLHHF